MEGNMGKGPDHEQGNPTIYDILWVDFGLERDIIRLIGDFLKEAYGKTLSIDDFRKSVELLGGSIGEKILEKNTTISLGTLATPQVKRVHTGSIARTLIQIMPGNFCGN